MPKHGKKAAKKAKKKSKASKVSKGNSAIAVAAASGSEEISESDVDAMSLSIATFGIDGAGTPVVGKSDEGASDSDSCSSEGGNKFEQLDNQRSGTTSPALCDDLKDAMVEYIDQFGDESYLNDGQRSENFGKSSPVLGDRNEEGPNNSNALVEMVLDSLDHALQRSCDHSTTPTCSSESEGESSGDELDRAHSPKSTDGKAGTTTASVSSILGQQNSSEDCLTSDKFSGSSDGSEEMDEFQDPCSTECDGNEIEAQSKTGTDEIDDLQNVCIEATVSRDVRGNSGMPVFGDTDDGANITASDDDALDACNIATPPRTTTNPDTRTNGASSQELLVHFNQSTTESLESFQTLATSGQSSSLDPLEIPSSPRDSTRAGPSCDESSASSASEDGVRLVGTIFKLAYRRASWKKRLAELTTEDGGQLRLFSVNAKKVKKLRTVISLAQCPVRFNPPFLLTQGGARSQKNIMMIESQRAVSVKSQRSWVQRDFFFAFASSQQLNLWKDAMKEMFEETEAVQWVTVESGGNSTVPAVRLMTRQEAAMHTARHAASWAWSWPSWMVQNARKIAYVVAASKRKWSAQINANICSRSVYMRGAAYEPLARLIDESRPLHLQSPLYAKFHEPFRSLMMFTYRSGFPVIPKTSLTSDTGWGCMARVGQMVLADSVISKYLGRGWVRDPISPPPIAVVEILRLFQDDPSAPFSIHSIVKAGSQHGIKPGEWFGPTAISYSIRDVVQASPISNSVTVHVGRDSALAKNEILELFDRASMQELPACAEEADGLCNAQILENSKQNPVQTATHVDEADGFEDVSEQDADIKAPPSKSVLILLPLRLGSGDVINPAYTQGVESLFRIPQFAGVLGGRPRAALYFVASRPGECVYLDPHVEHSYVPMDRSYQLSSFFPRSITSMATSAITPSLAVAFFCQDRGDFIELWTSLQLQIQQQGELSSANDGNEEWNSGRNPASLAPQLFTLMDERPLTPDLEDCCDSDGDW